MPSRTGLQTRQQLRRLFFTAIRIVCAFVLAFSGAFDLQNAWADDGEVEGGQPVSEPGGDSTGGSGDSGGGTDPGGGSGTDPGADPDPTPVVEGHVVDIGIFDFDHQSDGILAYATAGRPGERTITERGGSIDFDVTAYWNDGYAEPGWSHVTWSIEPEGSPVATITRDGILTAVSDGQVVVKAQADSAYTQGVVLEARVIVTIGGQTDSPYVVSITICDDAGVPIEPSYTFHDEELATALIELEARVIVHDPLTGTDTEYLVTPSSGLASQTGGAIANLEWDVAENSFGSVSLEGIYRPATEATNVVYAISYAGFAGQSVMDSATIIMPGEGGDAHPQDSLTLKVVWEAYPDQVVKEKTFSVAEMQAIGMHTVTYTAFGGAGGFKTYTGTGPYLAEVLDAAEIDTDGIKELQIESFDNPYVISWNLLVGKDRYYFPNMDIGSEAEAVQVAPMLALLCATAPARSSDPVSDLTPDDRFRLLFGSGYGDEAFTTTSMQRYWIHTIRIVLEGAPPAEGGGDTGDGGGTTSGEGSGGTRGGGAGTIEARITGGSGGGETDARSQIQIEAVSGGEVEPEKRDQGAWSILQAVNDNASQVDDIYLDNPFRPFVFPATAGVFAAGGLEAFVRFRNEKKVPR